MSIKRLIALIFIFGLAGLFVSRAQDAFNLPTPLYILRNEGSLERYGLGAEGVQTVSPEGAFVIDFNAAPDGNWLAYRTNEGLYLSEILGGTRLLIDESAGIPPLRGEGTTIAWASDVSKLAYTVDNSLRVFFRLPQPPLTPSFVNVADSIDGQGFAELSWSPLGSFLAARNISNDIWQIYRVAQNQLTLASIVPLSGDIAWRTDTQLIFAPLDGGLFQMDLAQANLQTPLMPTDVIYDVLYLADAQTLVAFTRPLSNSSVGFGQGVYSRVDLATQTRTEVGTEPLALDGLRWTPNAEFTVMFGGGVLALVNPADGSGFSLPIQSAVAYGWGQPPLPTVEGYPISSNLFFLAADENGVQQVWQLFRDGSPPQPLTRAAEDVSGYTLSPGGFVVAYSSASQLWLQPLNSNAEPTPLVRLSHNENAMPAFNRDGQQLAYMDGGIWTVPTSGGEPSLLAPDSLSEDPAAAVRVLARPRYSDVFGTLLVDVAYREGGTTGLLDLTSGELRELPFGYLNARWLYNGDILTFAEQGATSQAGVQITQVNDLDAPRVVLPPQISIVEARLIASNVAEDVRVILGNSNEGPYPLRIFNYRDGAGLNPVLERGFMQYPRLSADGGYVAGYVRIVQPTETRQEALGRLTLLNVATGEQVRLAFPELVSQIRWQD